MKLRHQFLLYLLSTAAAIAAPFVMTKVETMRRQAIPVNSEPALERTPELNHTNPGDSQPNCIAPDGFEYSVEDFQYAASDKPNSRGKQQRSLQHNYDVLYSCAVAGNGTVYVLGKDHNNNNYLRAHSRDGTVIWTVPTDEERSDLAIGRGGTPYLVTTPRSGGKHLIAYAADGSQRWSVVLDSSVWMPGNHAAPVIGPDGIIYDVDSIGASQTVRFDLIAIDPAGK